MYGTIAGWDDYSGGGLWLISTLCSFLMFPAFLISIAVILSVLQREPNPEKKVEEELRKCVENSVPLWA